MTDSVALLLRRAGFGPTATDLANGKRSGYSAVLRDLLAPAGDDAGAVRAPFPVLPVDPYTYFKRPPTAKEAAAADVVREDSIQRITRWWIDRLVVADHQGLEKLTFFWHGHWATSVKKVRDARLLLNQHQVLRKKDFREMARTMVTDAALIHWLDGQLNSRSKPNENLGRELMELFLLGIGNYTEADVKDAGRALTGWKVDYGRARSYFAAKDHDFGSKTILGVTRDFDAQSLTDFLLSQPICPRFIASRMWYRYGSAIDPIPQSVLDRMLTAFPYGPSMLWAMFEDEAFLATSGTMAKQPVEWLVGAMRQLGLRLWDLPKPAQDMVVAGLEALGQLPFAPPSVGGWPNSNAWLTTGATQIRLSLAGVLAEAVGAPQSIEGLAEVLAVETWTSRTFEALKDVPNPRHRLILGLVSPEYMVS
ncbi:MAG: DUF1800 family protein [Hamadaea sp.]|uniref:DUF1800 domain-containing protein n=1 Tax=Hamadaea sp. TaxID=2024425 RepID=UPI0017F27DC1|nr:DUF1800 family protein [Hamadaea sp.]NUT22824.1 DUF1800 family protein [Hamadaea sp.]